MHLTNKECHRLLESLPRIYDCRDFSDFPSVVLEIVNELIPVIFSSYNEINTADRMLRVFYLPMEFGMLADACKEPFWRYMDQHPLVPFLRQSPGTAIPKISDYLTMGQLQRLEIYQHVLEPQGVADSMIISVENEDQVRMFITMNRGKTAFTERDRTMAMLLRPHLKAAFENVRLSTNSRADGLLTAGVLGTRAESGRGVVVSTRDGRIVHANRKAAELLGRLTPIISGDLLPTLLREWLLKGLGQAAIGCILDLRLDEQGLKVRASALEGGLLLLVVEQKDFEISVSALRSSFALTSREATILYWLAQGKSTPEIAMILEISARTVEKHLEHVFAKIEVENRGSAVRKATAVLGLD